MADLDAADPPVQLMANEINDQKAIFQVRRSDFDPVGENESPLELPGRYATMQVLARLVVILPASHLELVVLDGDFDLTAQKAGNRQRDAQSLWTVVRTPNSLDIVGRIAFGA